MKTLGSDGWLTEEVVEAVKKAYSNKELIPAIKELRRHLPISFCGDMRDQATITKLIVGEI